MNATVVIRCIDCKKDLHIPVQYPHDHEGANLNTQVTDRLRLGNWTTGRRVRCPACQDHQVDHHPRSYSHPHPAASV